MLKNDIQLQRDVIDEMRWDPMVGPTEIGVAAKDGVVTLTGQVDTFPRRFAALRAAERVAGVRAIADELAVQLHHTHTRTDTELAHAVVHALRWDVLVPEAVKARVDDGWVWLDGAVDWPYQSYAAERSVRNITGVRGLTNQMDLRPRVSAPDVRERIEGALQRHAEIDAKRIQVETLDGRVTLTGQVHSWSERKDAERAAWSAPGVTAVADELVVQL